MFYQQKHSTTRKLSSFCKKYWTKSSCCHPHAHSTRVQLLSSFSPSHVKSKEVMRMNSNITNNTYFSTATSSSPYTTVFEVKRRNHLISKQATRMNSDQVKLSLSSISDQKLSTSNESESTSGTTTAVTATKPKFDNSESAHGAKSISELLRSLLVYQICKLPSIVQNAETLLSYSNIIFGSTITNWVVRNTFYRQFCAGRNETDILPTLYQLKQCNIGAILDYAAENDALDDPLVPQDYSLSHDIITYPPFSQPARIYKYQSEKECDQHVDIFLKCIRAVKQTSEAQQAESSVNPVSPGFAAIKVTALGNPLLLERMSIAIKEVRNLFKNFDLDNDGVITREEFKEAYTTFFNHDNDDDKNYSNTLSKLLDEELDPNHTDRIDYVTFISSKFMSLSNLQNLCSNCKSIGPLSLATLSNEELSLLSTMYDRAHTLAKEASKYGVRLLIDAEQTRYQPAIDKLTLELQETYNDKSITDVPIIFNTYQCYLKDVLERISIDLELSIRFNYHFGAKLVRGAYMVSERSIAKEMNIPSPIHSTIDKTHDCYDSVIEMLLKRKINNSNLETLEVMCATHNQKSIEKVLELMTELNLHDSSRSLASPSAATKGKTVYFAQLYGMSDNLTFPLGADGYSAYKYVPYGEVQEVMPYMLRRAQENSDVLGNAYNETSLLFGALKRRFLE